MWAVLAAGVASMVVGMIWYSPKVFGNKWMKLSGVKPSKKQGMAVPMLLGFISSLVMAYILANVIVLATAGTWLDGATVGFWVWLGFMATLTLGSVIWERRPLDLYWLNNAHNLLSLLVMGAILGLYV